MTAEDRRLLLLVDGNNILSRADFAAKGKHVAMSVGETNTAALVIFINMLSKYVRQVGATHIRVCWDAGHAMRDEIYPEYKAARRKGPGIQHEALEDPTTPFSQAKEFLTWAGVPHMACQGWEADDLIAAHTRQFGGDVVILSGDKDLLQLVDDGDNLHGRPVVTQIRPPDDEPWTEDRVEQKFGLYPHHMSHYLALVGDTSDGIPGVRGVGPKKALKALAEAEWDWEALLGSWEPERAAEARLMHSLVDLRTLDYPAALLLATRSVPRFEPVTEGTMTWEVLVEFCERYRLATVLERLRDGTLWADPVKPETRDIWSDDDTPGQSARSA